MRRKILKIYGVILSVGFIYLIWLRLTGAGIPCFVLSTTGYLCPGCGTSRMFVALSELDFYGAFVYNPVIFALLVVWNVVGMLCFLQKPRFVQKPAFLYSLLALSVVAMAVFGIVRNIP